MPNPLQPPWSQLIPLIPVADHSVEVNADTWQPHLANHGLLNLHQIIFADNQVIRLSRGRLLNFVYPNQQQKCLEIFMWGWPSRNRGNLRDAFLQNLNAISAIALQNQRWPTYFENLHNLGNLNISAITKLAYFYGHHFGNLRSLILDSIMIKVFSGARWDGLAMPEINYNNAVRRYPTYLNAVSQVAGQLGCAPDQIEFTLFSLGKAF